MLKNPIDILERIRKKFRLWRLHKKGKLPKASMPIMDLPSKIHKLTKSSNKDPKNFQRILLQQKHSQLNIQHKLR